jgi:hypothetical protein
MGFAHDPHRGVERERALSEHFGEPLANLFQITQHGVSSPAIRPGDENQFRTQITAG